MPYSNQNLDDLLNVLTVEELAILADEPTNNGTTINIQDSTINIYTNEQKKRVSHPYDDTPCPECQQSYCICDMLDEEDTSSLKWYAYPIWIMPLMGAIEIVKGVWSLGEHLLYSNDDNETIAIPQEIDNVSEIIDTEIVEDNLSETEVQHQLELYKQATEEQELSEESQYYTRLFQKAIA